MNNIILIGMPGVGKSTIGVILAKMLGYKFLDADLVIQEREGRLLKEIIADEGTDGFIRIENEVNASIDARNTIIATGGSVVYGGGAMAHLKSIGKIVYLEVDLESLKERIVSVKGRGVVLRDGQTLEDLYMERVPLYKKYADITVNENGCTVEETIDKVIEKLKSE